MIVNRVFSVPVLLICVALCNDTLADYVLPANTDPSNKLDLGPFDEGTILKVVVTGSIDLGDEWLTFADGSLVSPIANPTYSYINEGAANYPTSFGGDGINHFIGGGANFDTILQIFGPAGAMTTDTTNPEAIRLGAVIGTFSPSPGRSDWFLIGSGTTITLPGPSTHLYLAVNDAFYSNNTGSYSVSVSVVPEPTTMTLFCVGVISLGGWRLWHRRLSVSP